MVRVFIPTAGSRGDAEPFFALACGLIELPSVEHVTLMVPKKYLHLAPRSPKISTFSLRFDLDDIPEVFEDEIKAFGPVLSKTILPDADLIIEHAKKFQPSIVITSIFTFFIGDIVRTLLQIPFVILHPQPAFASAYYPSIMGQPNEAVEAFLLMREGKFDEARNDDNLKSHEPFVNESLGDEFVRDLNVIRDKYSIPRTSAKELDLLFAGKLENTHAMQATQSQLFPLPPDASPRAHIVGSFSASYLPPDWSGDELYPELAKFLQGDVKPIAVTYGSMFAGTAPDAVVRAILSGLRDAQVERIVVLPGYAKLGLHLLDSEKDADLLEWADERVFVTEGNVQYAWLFPKCEMVLCHCGAGTVGAALRAGLPMLGTPVIADQMFFIQLLSRLNMGLHVGETRLPSITAEAVKEGVLKIRESGALETTRAYGEKEVRLNEGVSKACSLIEKICTDTFLPSDTKAAKLASSEVTKVNKLDVAPGDDDTAVAI